MTFSGNVFQQCIHYVLSRRIHQPLRPPLVLVTAIRLSPKRAYRIRGAKRLLQFPKDKYRHSSDLFLLFIWSSAVRQLWTDHWQKLID